MGFLFPVSGMICKFDGRAMAENSPGLYSEAVNPASPTRGTVNISIEQRKSPVSRIGVEFNPVYASYTIGDLVRVTGPVSGARIPLSTTPRMSISWTGGDLARRFIVQIYEIEAV
jgi:hypothetical protein